MRKVTLYRLASSIVCLKKTTSIDELRGKYESECSLFLFERAMELLASLSQVCQIRDGKLCAKRTKINERQVYLAALS